MILFRITTKPYIHDLSGTGAMRYGGRWNPKGRRMLYTSESHSLAMLEVMANCSSNQIGRGFYCTELELPDSIDIDELTALPEVWNSYPFTSSTIDAGRQFLDQGGVGLKVPSSIVSSEFNYLLNPQHDNFHHLKVKEVKPLLFDQRLWN
ncbi:MAG: RES domain-containing protein [Reichenbachiella sp.]|uniref:RES family NAD+ phosphorylase n=1 Tax=Reichenbachiella sp. TaxID=2184521 RepID=UPI003296E8E9